MRALNKEQKKKICKYILNNTSDIVEKKHSDFLMEYIFPGHPDWNDKCGVGIDHIEVRPAAFGTKCFYLVRTDGSETDISYPSCITPHSKMEDIMKACRNSVSSTVELFRNSVVVPFICPITGEEVREKTDMHIDHYDHTFKEVVDLWLKDKNIDDIYKKTLSSNRDDCFDTYFDDSETILDFIQFHNKHTHLRPVSKKANLSVLTRKNIK